MALSVTAEGSIATTAIQPRKYTLKKEMKPSTRLLAFGVALDERCAMI